jgi:hypothetical protein
VHLLLTSTEYVMVPVTGPPGVDLTQFPVSIAIIPEIRDEPSVGDPAWRTAQWMSGVAALLVTTGDYPAGDYTAFVKVVAGPETPVVRSGRVRVGAGL